MKIKIFRREKKRTANGCEWMRMCAGTARGGMLSVQGVRSSEYRFCRGILRFRPSARSSAKALGGRKGKKHPSFNIQHSAVVKALWRDKPLNNQSRLMIFDVVTDNSRPATHRAGDRKPRGRLYPVSCDKPRLLCDKPRRREEKFSSQATRIGHGLDNGRR